METGWLSYVGNIGSGDIGEIVLQDISRIAVSPDGKHIYVGTAQFSALSVFTQDSNTGMLNYEYHYTPEVEYLIGLRGIYDIVVTPDGHYVYVSSVYDDTVTVFFLNGIDQPNLREAESQVGAPQGKSYEVYMDWITKAVDWRTM